MSETAPPIKLDGEHYFARGFVLVDGAHTGSRQRLWFRFVSLRELVGEPTFEVSYRGCTGNALRPVTPPPNAERVGDDGKTRILNVLLERDWAAVRVRVRWSARTPDGKAYAGDVAGEANLTTPLNTSGPASVCVPRARRRRLSAWLASSDAVVDGAKWVEKQRIKDPTERAAAEDATFGPPLARLTGVLDDVSIIRTLAAVTVEHDRVPVERPDPDHPGETITKMEPRYRIADVSNPGATWDRMFEPGLSGSTYRAEYCRTLLRVAHANRLQVLAGYAIGEEGKGESSPMGKSFLALISGPVGPIQQHAHDLVKFLWDDQKLDFDGLGLDIELKGLNEGHAGKMGVFIHALADLLRPRGKILTFASGVGAVTQGDTVVASPDGTPGFARAQPMDLAQGRTNVIARPMAYDIPLEDPKLNAWHESVVAYALDPAEGKLAPAQLQLGVKIVKNSAKVAGQANELGETKGTLYNKPDAVTSRCGTFLAANDVGLIVFTIGDTSPTTVDKLTRWDTALNTSEPKVPAGTPGEPIQAPRPKA